MTQFPKPDSKKERRARERARQKRIKKFRKDVFEAADGICESCGKEGTSAHHIEKRDANSPELDVRENGMCMCYNCHDKAENGDGSFSGNEFVLLVLRKYMVPGTVKHLQWHKAYDKLKEKVRNKRLSGKI